MKIIINGAGFENKGAEAMLQTVQIELLRRLDSVEFYLWRPPGWNNRFSLVSGCIPVEIPFFNPSYKLNIFGKKMVSGLWSLKEVGLKKALNLSYLSNKKKLFKTACSNYLMKQTGGIDAVIDISGYAYGGKAGYERVEWIEPLMDIMMKEGKPVFFFPQAWGDFDTIKTKIAVQKMLVGKNVWFYARDRSSGEYLKMLPEINYNDCTVFPDIVFRYNCGTSEMGRNILKEMGCTHDRPIIGVAPNTRVYERMKGRGSGSDYLKTLISVVKYCIEHFNVDIVLQSNEIIEYRNILDDRYLCSYISNAVNRPDRCFMTRSFLTAEQSRSIIGNFEYLIGSRFHTFIFGFSQGVPGSAISWSHKYGELFSLFGMKDNVLDCKEISTESVIESICRGWNGRTDFKPKINKRVIELRTEVDELFDTVAQKISGKQ